MAPFCSAPKKAYYYYCDDDDDETKLALAIIAEIFTATLFPSSMTGTE